MEFEIQCAEQIHCGKVIDSSRVIYLEFYPSDWNVFNTIIWRAEPKSMPREYLMLLKLSSKRGFSISKTISVRGNDYYYIEESITTVLRLLPKEQLLQYLFYDCISLRAAVIGVLREKEVL